VKVTAEQETESFNLDTEIDSDGSFRRQKNLFRGEVSALPGSEFPAEAGRYHLYISWACPWAHRTAIARHLKGLEEVLGMSVVNPVRDSRGWAFTGGEYVDSANGFEFLSEAYLASEPTFDQRVTVPVLWDRETRRIVNNDSSEVMRIIDSGFGELADNSIVLYPEELRPEIDKINTLVYDRVNNGVYKAGFTTSQAVYDEEVRSLFEALDTLESRLTNRRHLVGESATEADWRLFTTLVRFDSAYHGHFKCNLRRIEDYPALSAYLLDLFQRPGIADTVRIDEIKDHYYRTHPMINPTGIVPAGPELDLTTPHGRESLT
jgi:glutathionyl-hydroquinone reductase